MAITKSERTELRSVVRQQFKVLRSEIRRRADELNAEVQTEITSRETEDDKKRADVEFLVNKAALEFNCKINDALRENGFEVRGDTERMWVAVPRLWGDKFAGGGTDRDRLKIQAAADIRAKVSAALVTVDRQEADLLRELAVGALESEEAHAFLAAIPTVGQLVPATRLAELEAALRSES